MIEKISVKRNPFFKNSDFREFNFKPGLNILLGPNTSGKSSLINIIKYYNAYVERKSEVIQNFHNYAHYKYMLERGPAKVTGKISRVLEYKPQELHENSNLNFMQTDTLTAIASRFQSKGEGRYSYHNFFVDYVTNNQKLTNYELEALKEQKLEYDNKLVIIADEPENSMALNMQFGLFDWFLEFAETWKDKLQIIIASHSLAAYTLTNNNNVNIIEMNKGWVNKINNQVKMALQVK